MMQSNSFLGRLMEVAAAQPDSLALVSHGTQGLTYAELVGRAARAGQRLRERGAGPGQVVGLLLGRSADHVVALLGAWFAGAAFLPLDPGLPSQRLAFMVRDAGLRLLITPEQELPHGTGVSFLAPEDLAYMIYTSGSTGEPKGVMVPHRGIVNLIEAQVRAFGLGPGSRSLFYLSPGFDASLSDIGTALLSGATLCIEADEALRSPPALLSVLRERRITHLDLPPALLRVLDPEAMPPTLTTLIIGGEACPPEVVRRWARRFRVINVYGPTEATVCASLCVCDPARWDRPLIGRPLPGVSLHLLDEQLDPVPQGSPAELYIGGAGLALGYLNRPELTARKFIQRAGQRLYRTGDLVVEREDGEIEFLGRIDRQVKLRGLLIEPEEIEAQLLRHPRVQHAAVVKRPLAAGGRPVLVAFVVPHPGDTALSPSVLRDHLAGVLPGWMLPQRYELLSRMPLTMAGKIDLSALAEYRLTDRRSAAPSSPVEVLLCGVWQRVLGLPSVGVNEDFFALGGDSLALLEVLAGAEALGLQLSPELLLRHPTIAGLASAAGQGPGEVLDCATLRADARRLLEELEWRERPPAPEYPSAQVLLTGTTGFLGSRLLAELLQRTSARLHCLVRAGSRDEGEARVQAALRAHGILLSLAQATRMRILCGDLSRPCFGLSGADWEDLATSIDTVYHCAATVNMVLPYNALRGSNVLGTREVLRLLGEARPKQLHYASTLSVFVATDRNTGDMAEADDLGATREVHGGYAQSKWAAEHLLRSARGAGPISYYRLGLITGDSRTGYCAETDQLRMFARGIAALGCVPAGAGATLLCDVTPVDYAAAAIAHLSLQEQGGERTFHIANQRSLSLAELLAAMRSFGVPIAEVGETEFRERLQGAPGPAATAYLLLCSGHRGTYLFQATSARFRMERALAGLAGSGLACPPPAEALLHTYLRHIFRSEGLR